jgi:hypothetical protein
MALVAGLTLQLLQKGHVKVPRGLVYMAIPLLAFALYAVLSAAILPRVFEGIVSVFPPDKGIDLENLTPLAPSSTNLSQAAYIVFLTVFALAVPLEVVNLGQNRGAGYYLKSYLLAGCIVIFFGFYQLAAAYTGVPYPTGLLYSNPGYAVLNEQAIAGGVKRLSSTLTEPSVASYYLVGVFAFSLWYYLHAPRSPRSWFAYLFCLFSALALLLTTATTAYLAVGAVLLLVVTQVLFKRETARRAPRLVNLAIPMVLVAVVAASLPGIADSVGAVAESALFEKSGSDSFRNRIGTGLHSLGVLVPTWGYGVGWGSDRPSGLVFSTLSNAGLWGSLLLAWFGARVFRLARRTMRQARRSTNTDPESRVLTQSFAFAVVAMLVAEAVSVPDLTQVSFWLNLSVLMALTVLNGKLDSTGEAAVASRTPSQASTARTFR